MKSQTNYGREKGKHLIDLLIKVMFWKFILSLKFKTKLIEEQIFAVQSCIAFIQDKSISKLNTRIKGILIQFLC